MTLINSEEIVEAFLSLLLKNGVLIYSVLDKVTPAMLVGDNNQMIYRAMIKLAKKGIEPSKILIKNELIKDNNFLAVGGEEYINELLMKESDDKHLYEYTTAISDSYKARELIKLGNRIEKLVEKNDPSLVISRTSKFLDNLSIIGSNEEVIYLGDTIDNTIVQIKERVKNPGIQGISTGFPTIDKDTTGYCPGELWYIGARPSQGKTTFLHKSLLESAMNNISVLLINREMYLNSINERLLSMISRVPFFNIRSGYLSEIELEKLEKSSKFLQSIPFYIDNNWTGDENYLFSMIRKYHQLKKVRIIGVDYIQLLAPRSDDSLQELGRLSRNLKLLAGELGLTIVILSQLNRKVEERTEKRPQMHDLRQAGYLEEDGDYMVGLYRDELYRANSPDAGKMEFIVRKARNSIPNTYMLNFDGSTVTVFDDENVPKELEYNGEQE
jgi:replicative DNA helicase